MSQRHVIHHVAPETFGKCFTPRSLQQAFGPYARLDVERRDPDRMVGIGLWIVCGAVVALILAGVLR